MAHSTNLAIKYETLLRRAHGRQTDKNGAYAQVMINLIDREAGQSTTSRLPAAEQLEKVKQFIVMALDVFLKKKMSQSLRQSLEQLRKQTLSAHSSMELLEICELALDIVTD